MRINVIYPDGTIKSEAVRQDSITYSDKPVHLNLTYHQTKLAKQTWQRVGRHLRPPAFPNQAKWIDGFRYDISPDREIAAYLKIADAYDLFVSVTQLPQSDIVRRKTLLMLNEISRGVVDVAHHTGEPDAVVEILRQCWQQVQTKQL